MVDVSGVVMAASNDHRLALDRGFGRWRQGEFVHIGPYQPGGNGHPRFFNIHVKTCPGTIEDVRAFLTQEFADYEYDPLFDRRKTTPYARCRRPVDFNLLTARQWSDLKANSELTFTWAELTGPGDFMLSLGSKCVERTEKVALVTRADVDRK